MRKELVLGFDIKAQPDDVTCGPTCLHALYEYYKEYLFLHFPTEKSEFGSGENRRRKNA